MLGLEYSQLQTYTFTDKEQLKHTLEVEGIRDAQFHDDEKLVQYTLKRNQYIRLSDLVFWIETGIIKFHYEQILELFNNLCEKVIQSKIEHGYLSMDRIWLKLDEKSVSLSVIYLRIKYRIVFTGYQCPCYEEGQKQASNDCLKMFDIIQAIILRCYDPINNELISQISQSQNLQMLHGILQNLLNQVNDYEENPNQESSLIQNNLYRKLNELIIIYKNNQQIFDFSLKNYIEQITNIKDWQKDIQNISYKYEETSKLMNQLQKEKQEVMKNYKQSIVDSLKTHLSEVQNTFKIQIDEKQQKNLVEQIYSNIETLKFWNYFENSLWIIRGQEIEWKQMLDLCLSKLVSIFTERIFNDFLSLQILMLIDDLI